MLFSLLTSFSVSQSASQSVSQSASHSLFLLLSISLMSLPHPAPGPRPRPRPRPCRFSSPSLPFPFSLCPPLPFPSLPPPSHLGASDDIEGLVGGTREEVLPNIRARTRVRTRALTHTAQGHARASRGGTSSPLSLLPHPSLLSPPPPPPIPRSPSRCGPARIPRPLPWQPPPPPCDWGLRSRSNHLPSESLHPSRFFRRTGPLRPGRPPLPQSRPSRQLCAPPRSGGRGGQRRGADFSGRRASRRLPAVPLCRGRWGPGNFNICIYCSVMDYIYIYIYI